MKTLPITEFGNPILRQTAKRLTVAQIRSASVQALIEDIRHSLISQKLGVGLAAPQVGESLALTVIAIRPTKHRPSAELFDLVMINPKITRTIGQPEQLWEGCISSGAGQANLFAKLLRFPSVVASYLDAQGQPQSEQFDGLVAQVVQHETDHLNGILFVDNVTDTKTYMTMNEYQKQITKGLAS